MDKSFAGQLVEAFQRKAARIEEVNDADREVQEAFQQLQTEGLDSIESLASFAAGYTARDAEGWQELHELREELRRRPQRSGLPLDRAQVANLVIQWRSETTGTRGDVGLFNDMLERYSIVKVPRPAKLKRAQFVQLIRAWKGSQAPQDMHAVNALLAEMLPHWRPAEPLENPTWIDGLPVWYSKKTSREQLIEQAAQRWIEMSARVLRFDHDPENLLASVVYKVPSGLRLPASIGDVADQCRLLDEIEEAGEEEVGLAFPPSFPAPPLEQPSPVNYPEPKPTRNDQLDAARYRALRQRVQASSWANNDVITFRVKTSGARDYLPTLDNVADELIITDDFKQTVEGLPELPESR